MSLRRWLIRKIHYELDIKGMAVALAVLVGVSLFSGKRDNQSMQESRQSEVSQEGSQMDVEHTSTKEAIETIQPSYNHAKLSPRLDASLTTPVIGLGNHEGK